MILVIAHPVRKIYAQTYTFIQAKTNSLRLASPSNFLYFSVVAGSNIFIIPTNFPDGTWGIIINASGSSTSPPAPAMLHEDGGYFLSEDGGKTLLE